jgi:hypothetical protein
MDPKYKMVFLLEWLNLSYLTPFFPSSINRTLIISSSTRLQYPSKWYTLLKAFDDSNSVSPDKLSESSSDSYYLYKQCQNSSVSKQRTLEDYSCSSLCRSRSSCVWLPYLQVDSCSGHVFIILPWVSLLKRFSTHSSLAQLLAFGSKSRIHALTL